MEPSKKELIESKKISELIEKRNKIIQENMPIFERGIAEASIEREFEIWEDMEQVFKKHNIMPAIKTRLVSENQASNDERRPHLVCPGVEVTVTYMVAPRDKQGKSGIFPTEVVNEISKINQEITKLAGEKKK